MDFDISSIHLFPPEMSGALCGIKCHFTVNKLGCLNRKLEQPQETGNLVFPPGCASAGSRCSSQNNPYESGLLSDFTPRTPLSEAALVMACQPPRSIPFVLIPLLHQSSQERIYNKIPQLHHFTPECGVWQKKVKTKSSALPGHLNYFLFLVRMGSYTLLVRMVKPHTRRAE